ncbi:MAG TPA: RNA polymerase sigma factor, partial [Acidimicrobiales bacterium]
MRTTGLRDADLAQRATEGDGEAFGLLFERWFDRAFDVAWHIVRNRDTAAEVAQEAFATAWQEIAGLRQPESFGGWLLRITRNKGLNRLQRDRRIDPVGGDDAVDALQHPSRSRGAHAADPVADPVVAGERDDLVWAAAAALGDDDASLLNLHLRHGLGPAELAGELAVEPNAVHQRLFRLKKRLGDAIGAWVLWRSGDPACNGLRRVLAGEDAGGLVFSRPVAAAIVTHIRRCEDCSADRQTQLSPEALFSAVPLVAAGPMVRAKAASALEASGVPTSGGESAGGANDGAHLAGRRARRRRNTGRSLVMAAAGIAAVTLAVVAVAERAGDNVPVETADEVAERIELPPSSSTTLPTTLAEAPATTTIPGEEVSVPPEEPTTTSTTMTTAPAAPAPVIGGFRDRAGTSVCPAGRIPVTFAWSSTNADSAVLGPTGGLAEAVPPSGTADHCSLPDQQW